MANIRQVLFILIAAWLIPATVLAHQHQLDDSIIEEFGLEFAQNYLEASLAHDEMWAVFPRSEDDALEHPDYYGGHYFCEKGMFVYNVVDSLMADAETDVFAEFLEKDSVDVQKVEFSHEQLLLILDEIAQFTVANPHSPLEISTWGIDACANRVVVKIHGYNQESEAIFKRDVIDSPMITLEEGPPADVLIPRANVDTDRLFAQTETTLQPGTRVNIGDYGFSVGYPATRGAEAGFVTALHGHVLDGYDVRAGDAVVGYVTEPIVFDGSVDGAFISLQHAGVGSTVDDKTLAASDMRPSQGMILASISTPPDCTTRLQRNIKVTNAHYWANFGGGLVLSDMIQTDGDAQSGESGGLVFRPVGNSAQIMGIIVGSESTSAEGKNMFFSWAGAIDGTINVAEL